MGESRTTAFPVTAATGPVADDTAATLLAPSIVDGATTRPLRVLHIGNIANNAYYNSLLLRRVGYESYVLQYDYYHAVSYPEWETADFDSERLGDLFHPDWRAAGVDADARPEWHAIGPLAVAAEYLISVVERDAARRAELAAEIERRDRRRRQLFVISERRPELVGDLRQLRQGMFAGCRLVRRHAPTEARRALRRVALRVSREPVLDRFSRRARAVIGAERGVGTALVRSAALVAAPALAPAAALHRRRATRRTAGLQARLDLEVEARRIARSFAVTFPWREPMATTDITQYASTLGIWERLLPYFDVVIGYSTDPILPFLAGRPYLAFEHGTLREVPYWENGTGRLTSLAYRRADHVLITNEDCVASAARLGLARTTVIPHPYDNDRVIPPDRIAAARTTLQEMVGARHVLLAAARHDWVPGTGFADKGNDRWIEALRIVRDRGHDLGVVTVEMGANVAQSRALIADLGLGGIVAWQPFLSLHRLETWALACDAVLDQFFLGTGVGGVAFKTLAVGATLLSSVDQDLMAATYGEPIPLLSCASAAEIADRIEWVLTDPTGARAIGEDARRWVDRHYGWRRTTRLVDAAIRSSLARRGVDVVDAGGA